MTIRSGVKSDGTLVARQARVVFDSGGYGAFKPTVYLRGADHLCGVYRIPHARIDSYMVYTNNVPKGHMRSPAKPQVVFAVEAHTDLIARELGMDPHEFPAEEPAAGRRRIAGGPRVAGHPRRGDAAPCRRRGGLGNAEIG